MWEYNHTDEMYTGKYDRSEKLYHSDVYLGQDYTDGIYHFKYIKREKVNGKWVYYYKDDLTATAQKNYNQAQSNFSKATKTQSTHEKNLDKYRTNVADNRIKEKVSKSLAKSYKWYQGGKKKKAEKAALTATQNKINNETKARATEQKLEKAKQNTDDRYMEWRAAGAELRRSERKDKAKKFLSKLLVKGLNKAEDIKEDVNKLKKKGIKGIAKDAEKAIDRTTDKIEKGVKKTANKIEKGSKKAVKNIKKDIKQTKNDIIDSNRYASAKLRKEDAYVDSKGNVRLTRATQLGNMSIEDKDWDSDKFFEYLELQKQEDRINENRKKNKKKKK